MKHPVGRVNYWAERTRNRLGWVGAFATIATAVKVYGLSWWWALSLIPLAGISVWIDKKFIAPGEFLAQNKANPEWREVYTIIKELKEKMK